jgi:glycosyltransferase involved in cell wall biosynthesis
LRVLTVTRIFPNAVEPLACAFNRQQLAALSRLCDVEVAAAIPHLPGARHLLANSRVAKLAEVPEREIIDGIPVLHPRIAYVPKGGSLLAPLNVPLYLAGLLPHLSYLRSRGFDAVLGTYLYPDACAAAALARLLGVPYATKVHGTDVNLVAGWRSVQPIIGAMLRNVGAAVAVSRPMLDKLVELGAPRGRCALVENGVDRSVFRPQDRLEARRELGLETHGPLAVFVGRLVVEKGVRELVTALRSLPGVRVALLGPGPLRAELEATSRELEGRLILAGDLPLTEVSRWLAAADALVLPSWAEGTPNVVLEALAAGRPVVATHVGGIPDVIEHGVTGLLVPPRDAPALATAMAEALGRAWDEAALLAAAPPSWDESAAKLLDLLENMVAVKAPLPHAA